VPRVAISLHPREEETVIKPPAKNDFSTSPMHVISRKRLNEFAKAHPDSKASLAHWYELIKGSNFSSFVELRTTFPSGDQVGKLTVFNTSAETRFV
jgi:hypothetical protein